MRTIIVLLSCLLTLLAASNPPATRSKGEHTRVPAKGTAPAINDIDLERNIRARFSKSKIAKNNFTVRAQGGVVTLEGKTDVIQHKGTATRIARTAGARDVRNKIQVSDEAKQRAAGNLDKGRRRAQVKRSDAKQPASGAK